MCSTSRHPPSSWALLSVTLLGLSAPVVASVLSRASNATTDDYVIPNSNPDANGAVLFSGFDLSKPYPGSVDAWAMDLNFTRNVASPSHPEGNVTRITAQMGPRAQRGGWANPFEGGTDEAIGSWRVTVLTFALDEMRQVPDKNSLEDGACPTSVLSEQCKADIRAGIVSDPRVMSGEGGPRGNLYDSCEGYRTVAGHGLAMNENFTRTATSLWEVSMAKMDAYNVYGVRTFPFVIVWGHSNTTARGTRLPDDHVDFVCLKVENNRPPAAMPTGGSKRLVAEIGASWCFAGLAVVMGMYAF